MLMMANVASAAPTTDFGNGKGIGELNIGIYDVKFNGQSFSNNYSGTLDLGGGMSYTKQLFGNVGVYFGGTLARYKKDYGTYTDTTTFFEPVTGDLLQRDEALAYELDMLYSVNKNIALFVGVAGLNLSTDYKLENNIANFSGTKYEDYTYASYSENGTGFQRGVALNLPLTKELKIYGKAATGTDDIKNYEAGIRYKFCDTGEFKIGYYKFKMKKAEWVKDVEVSGVGAGVYARF